jgi:glycosyltransferase involved in cell wall biosynthesis
MLHSTGSPPGSQAAAAHVRQVLGRTATVLPASALASTGRTCYNLHAMSPDLSNPRRVAVNAHLISGQAGYRSAGVHQYIVHLLAHLPTADLGMEIVGLVGRAGVSEMHGLPLVRSRLPTHRAAVRILWEQAIQPFVLRKVRANLVHGPVNVAPLLATCPSVITIHDLSFLRCPNLLRPANRTYLRIMTQLSARRAKRIIAVSRFTARESVALLGVPESRIETVYHGVDASFRPLPASQVDAFRAERGLPDKFVLFVGTLEPRKNVDRLVEAYARLGSCVPPLVLVGGKGWLYADLFAHIEALGLTNRVRFIGYVPQDELPLWYNAALVFAYPSLYEGFGLPVLEAQACGTPVLTSASSALPEAAGDAAVFVDPTDTEALRAGLDRLLSDGDLRRDLRERGLSHSRGFSWRQAACQTTAVYRQAMAMAA